MHQEGVRPDSVKDMVALNACASIVVLEEGTCAHEQIIQSGWDSDAFVGSSLVDIYAIWVTFGGCWESVQQDSISSCGHLEGYDWNMCNVGEDRKH